MNLLPRNLVWAFARMNPPTIGHRLLVDRVKQVAGEMKAHLITLSGSYGDAKNPLHPSSKLDYARAIAGYARYDVAAVGSSFVHQLASLYRHGVRDLTVVCGSDRIKEYSRIFETYNGKEDIPDDLLFFKFDSWAVLSSGERDADNPISATKVREAVRDSNYKAFIDLYPNTDPVVVYDLYGALRSSPAINKASTSRVAADETGRKEEEGEDGSAA